MGGSRKWNVNPGSMENVGWNRGVSWVEQEVWLGWSRGLYTWNKWCVYAGVCMCVCIYRVAVLQVQQGTLPLTNSITPL